MFVILCCCNLIFFFFINSVGAAVCYCASIRIEFMSARGAKCERGAIRGPRDVCATKLVARVSWFVVFVAVAESALTSRIWSAFRFYAQQQQCCKNGVQSCCGQ